MRRAGYLQTLREPCEPQQACLCTCANSIRTSWMFVSTRMRRSMHADGSGGRIAKYVCNAKVHDLGSDFFNMQKSMMIQWYWQNSWSERTVSLHACILEILYNHLPWFSETCHHQQSVYVIEDRKVRHEKDSTVDKQIHKLKPWNVARWRNPIR